MNGSIESITLNGLPYKMRGEPLIPPKLLKHMGLEGIITLAATGEIKGWAPLIHPAPTESPLILHAPILVKAKTKRGPRRTVTRRVYLVVETTYEELFF